MPQYTGNKFCSILIQIGWFQPMYDYFHRELLKRRFAMADETRVQILKEEERRAQTQSFMWLFRSGEDGLPAIILYGYSPTRSGSHAKEFLKGSRVSGNGWLSGLQQPAGYQAMFLLGTHPPVLYRRRSQRETVWLQLACSAGSPVL